MYRDPGPRPPLPTPSKGPYGHLERIAKALDAPYLGALGLEAWFGTLRVSLGLELNSGSVCGITIRVTCGPFPDVTLRRETESDRKGKARAIAREVQTGDDDFDRAIYIESDALDPSVKQVLQRPEARTAIMRLVDGTRRLELDRSGILYKLGADDKADGPDFDPARILPVLEQLAIVAETPAVFDGGVRKERRGVWLPLVAGLVFMPAGLVSCIVGLESYDVMHVAPIPIAVAILIGAWFVARPLVARIVAGDSRSFGRYRVALFLLFVNAILWGVAVPVAVNGFFDGSAAVAAHGTVTAAHWDGDDGTTKVDVRWQDGDTSSHTFTGKVEVGAPVLARRHPGALGMPWLERSSATSP